MSVSNTIKLALATTATFSTGAHASEGAFTKLPVPKSVIHRTASNSTEKALTISLLRLTPPEAVNPIAEYQAHWHPLTHTLVDYTIQFAQKNLIGQNPATNQKWIAFEKFCAQWDVPELSQTLKNVATGNDTAIRTQKDLDTFISATLLKGEDLHPGFSSNFQKALGNPFPKSPQNPGGVTRPASKPATYPGY